MSALIQLQHVKKSYALGDTLVRALRGIDLTVNTGEFTALIGPSGSGKSTLLHLCGLLDRADEGSLTLADTPIDDLPEPRLALIRRADIGFVFQGFNLVPVMSARENVEYPLLLLGTGAAERRQRVQQMLERVGLQDFGGHRPDKLSGGQQQRVAIARALVKLPKLVIADEPTANLDSETATQMIDLMHELAKEHRITFLIATHDDRMAARCGRIVHLHDGVIQ
jgi:putative ABC transport system ATP-binding protein